MALTLTLGWAGVLLVVAIAWGAGLWRGYRKESPAPRWLIALLPLAGGMMIWAMTVDLLVTPFQEWNAARVAPVVAWGRGFPLYFPLDDGPGTAFIYPPVSAILRLPLAWLNSPTAVVILSATLNAFLYHLPLIWFIWKIRATALLRWLGLLVLWGFSIELASLQYSAYWVHADAPGLSFGLMAIGMLLFREKRTITTGRLMLCAMFIMLAIGSKQTMSPLVVVLPLYVLLRDGWQKAMQLVAATGAMLLAGTLLCIAVWGWDAIAFNWFGIAAGQPWQFEDNGRIASFLIWSGTFLNEAMAPALAMGVISLLLWPSLRHLSRTRGRLLRQVWVLPLVLAIVMAPLAIMSIAKRGGWGNSLSVTTFYLVAATGAMIANHRRGLRQRHDRTQARAVVGGAAMLAIALGVYSITPFTTLRTKLQDVANLERNPEAMAFEFSRKNPRRVYFPRNPLATLMAEGRYYIFEFGMLDEMMAGRPFAAERIGNYLPQQMDIIAFPPEREAGLARMEMPGFTQRVEIPDLPGWIALTRPRAP